MSGGRLPRALFVSHGAPTLPLDDHPARAFLQELGTALPKPRAVVIVSPHWTAPVFAIKDTRRYSAWHDFHGFPEELYKLRYDAPGEPELAAHLAGHLQASGVPTLQTADARLDHGAWVPLMLMYPAADVPVVNVAISSGGPGAHFALGRALAQACADDILIIGSGGTVHNLRELARPGTPPAGWARGFDDWLAQRLLDGRHGELLDYRAAAPDAVRAHPTEDHLLPLFAALGAGGGKARQLHHSFSYGNIGMAAYAFDR